MTLSTDTTGLQITRVINAPRKRVYTAWTDAELARQWWRMDGCVTEELILDVWRGGRLHWVLNTTDQGALMIQGKFRKVHPQEKIIHTWQWMNAPAWKDALSLVTVEFWDEEDSSHTEVRLTQERLPDKAARDSHIAGWNSSLDQLEKLLSSS